MDNRSKVELDLINALETNCKVSQITLANRLGIAAGLVNIIMKRAVKSGVIKMKQIPARRYAYYLTPKGFSEKAKLVAEYLDSSLKLYRKLRVQYRDIFSDLETQNIRTDIGAAFWSIAVLLKNPKFTLFIITQLWSISAPFKTKLAIFRSLVRKTGIYGFLSQKKFSDVIREKSL